MEQTGGKWMSLIGAYMIVKGIVDLPDEIHLFV